MDPKDSLHFVVPEIRYLGPSEDFHPRMKAKGWEPRSFQGRPAIERKICRNCLNDNRLRDDIWGELKQNAKRLEKPKDETADYYRVLCEC